MSEETPAPTRTQVQTLLDKLLPPNEEMDTSSALLIDLLPKNSTNLK